MTVEETVPTLTELGWSHFFQQQLDLDELGRFLPMRVFALHGQLFEVIGETGRELLALPGTWKKEWPEDLPTVGDWLLLDPENRQPVRLLERKSLFKRMASGRDVRIQLLAANIDILFIVTSCNREFNLSRLERYLALAHDSGVEPVIVLTKTDLCKDIEKYIQEAGSLRPDPVIEAVNACDPESVDRLRGWCEPGRTVALVGSSGVGKSTLINSLFGEEVQATADIRDVDEKGRHTTTSRSLHFLPGGGLLLDSPGIRELQLGDCAEGIASVFGDVESVARRCRFRNCRHEGEAGCAVDAAVDSGELDPRRVENYRKLQAEQDRMNESLAEKRRKDKTFGKMCKDALAKKKHRGQDFDD